MIDPETMAAAELQMWLGELNVNLPSGLPDWFRRRIAAQRVCELIGIADVLRAVATDGALRVPPAWPEVDIVPCGGGPGFIRCEVRTLTEGQIRVVSIGIASHPGADYQGQIREAVERGRHELRKLIEPHFGGRITP